MQIALITGRRFVVPYKLTHFNRTICILREQRVLGYLTESNQGKEALKGTAKHRKQYSRTTMFSYE